ncbi:ribosomal protection-like ABC-F family protein [Candidatus Cloacimonadota bacterium]
MIDIGLKDIVKSYGADNILRKVSFDLHKDERLGMIGVNGSGKTTIFKIIAGIEVQESGMLHSRNGVTVGYLHQIPDLFNNFTALEVLREAFSSIFQVKERMERLEDEMSQAEQSEVESLMRIYGELQVQFEQSGGYDIDVELEKICSGLKIDDHIRKRSFCTLSGGEKTTLMLGKILLEKPDVLLLDEPTNHLDIESVEWLETYLNEYKGSLIVVSHDRYFLDKIVTRIVELEDGEINNFAGNYSYYNEEKERRFQSQFEIYKDTQKKIKAMKAAAERFRIWGRINTDNNAHMARAKRLEQKIEELKEITRPRKNKSLEISFNGKRSGNDVIVIKDLDKKFGDKIIFNRLDMHLSFKAKAAVLGRNGSGKSTLFKIILDQLKPDDGDVKVGSSVKIGYLEQDVSFPLEEKSVLEMFRYHYPMFEGEARNKLARFRFTGTDVFKRVKDLSGGEKVRLRLCLLIQQELNLLLLDEPTNHLDIASREMIENTLREFGGTILFISHDRYFINRICSSVLHLENGKLKRYGGNYDHYRKMKGREELKASQPEKKKKPRNVNVDEYRQLRKRLVKLEEEILWKESELKIKEDEMTEYPTDYQKLTEIHEVKCEIKADLKTLYDEWGELSDSLAEGE